MKYIHIVQFHLISGGGVGSVITDLCQEMSKTSNEVYVFSLQQRKGINYEDEISWAEQYGIHVELMQHIGESKFKAVFNLRRRIKELIQKDKCCLFVHLKWGVLAGMIASWGIAKAKIVEVYHSGYINYRLQSFISRPFISHYISVSKDAKNQLEKWFGVKSNKITVVYNGVDLDEVRKAAGIKSNSDLFRFVSVGRLSFEKGFKTPIEAFGLLRKLSRLEDCTYTMVGDGNQRLECENLAQGFVKFTGVIPRNAVYPIIASSDVMILPSLWEGNSILLLEVLAIGRAMILSDIPSFREVMGFEQLKDGEIFRMEPFGAIFRAENIESCKNALLAVYENKEKVKEMSEYASKFAGLFSIKKQAQMYFNIADRLFNIKS